jgi:hypothetical protein
MAWTKEHWDNFRGASLDGPHYQNSKSLMSSLPSTGERSIYKALLNLKERESAAGKKRKQKQSWNYG